MSGTSHPILYMTELDHVPRKIHGHGKAAPHITPQTLRALSSLSGNQHNSQLPGCCTETWQDMWETKKINTGRVVCKSVPALTFLVSQRTTH